MEKPNSKVTAKSDQEIHEEKQRQKSKDAKERLLIEKNLKKAYRDNLQKRNSDIEDFKQKIMIMEANLKDERETLIQMEQERDQLQVEEKEREEALKKQAIERERREIREETKYERILRLKEEDKKKQKEIKVEEERFYAVQGRAKIDPVAEFLLQRCICEPQPARGEQYQTAERAGVLLKAYRQFLLRYEIKYDARKLKTLLIAKGFLVKRDTKGGAYYGIRLMDQWREYSGVLEKLQ